MSKIRKNSEQKLSTFKAAKVNISLSWQYMTTNKSFTLDYFKSDIRRKCQAMDAIFELVHEISSHDWIEILSRNKRTFGGCESLKVKQINFLPCGYELSSDEKILSFRFSNQEYRLLGIQKKDILYVIGYDFSYSAYAHGH